MRARRLELTTLEDRSTPAAGLSATYWDNINFTGASVTRVDPTPYFDWGQGSPAATIQPDTFSARWTGKVQAVESGSYLFRTWSDDGIRVWVNNTLLIDNWTDHPPSFNLASITLTAGQKYDLRIDYYENGGGAVMQLEWARPNGQFQAIPTAQLTTPNVAPTDVTLSAASVPVSQPVGTVVGTLAATDPDAGDTHTFALVAGTGSTNNSQFQVVGNQLRTNAVFASPTSFSVRVRATDAGGLSFEKAFAVTVTSGQLNVIDTGHDLIPDFGTNPTITATRSGNWSDPTMWSTGAVPGFGSIVGIGAGRVVTYDYSYASASAAPATVSVRAGGTLAFRTDVNTRLITSNLQVLAGGTLTVGTAANPVAAAVTAEIVIANRPLNLATDPEQFGNGLIVLGTLKMHGSAKRVNGADLGYVKLASAPLAGQTTLSLSAAVSGWRAGDKLVLPDTRQFFWGNTPYPTRQTETVTIAANGVSADGRTITLTAPLAFDHRGQSTPRATLIGHVGNLTRNVVIRSESPTGTYTGPGGATLSARGHTFYTTRADVDVRYAEYRDLGRTTDQTLDDTTNRKGRYAAHLHHLIGPATVPANGRQFTLVGNAMNDTTSPRKWPIALHDSHYGLVEGTTLYGGTGAGIATEDGSESYNLLKGNFIVGITGNAGVREKERADVGADGFWLAGPNNDLRDNVVAAVARAGYVVFGGSNTSGTTNPVTLPAFQGADPEVNGTPGDTGQMAIRGFVNNEAYSSLKGIETWYIGHSNYYDAFPGAVGESLISGGRFWNIFRHVFEGNQQNHLTVDGLVAIGDPSFLGPNDNAIGLEFRQSQQIVVRNVSVENYKTGLIVPSKIAPVDPTGAIKVENVIPTRVLNSYFRNTTDVQISPTDLDAFRDLPPVVTIFDNNVTAGDVSFRRTYSAGRFNNIAQINRVYVLSHNGNATANYQLYANEQAKGFVMPVSTGDFEGAPVAGWTNEQLWNSTYRTRWGYRYAVFGDVMPDAAFDVAGFFNTKARTLTAAEVTQLRA